MKQRYIIALAALLVTVTAGFAQGKSEKRTKRERTVFLGGHVKNSFTKAGVPDAKVTLMRTDSTVVDTMTVWTDDYSSAVKVETKYHFRIPAKAERYIIKAVHPDYEDCYVDFEIKTIARNTYFDAPHHLMRRRNPQTDLEQMLDAVQVQASKVKIAYRGDTIVYNADAFNLPEGSMLDALIRQLPGVELSDDGVIKVNGKQVDYLTLNGKDFFKGKNKVMLDNLPYYTVENVRAYHKSTEMSEWMGREVEQKEYVMDVTLKREYNKGYILNAEAAGGTEERYLGRLFGLRYTDNSRLSVFGNTNNVNESRKPGEKGEWSPSNSPQGLQTTRHAGIDLMIDDKEKRFIENGNVELKHTENTDILQSARESFLSTGNSYGRSLSHDRDRSLSLSAVNEFTWKWSQDFRLYTRLSMDYNKRETDGLHVSGTFDHEPSAFGTTMQVLDSLYATRLNPNLQGITLNRRRSVSTTDGSALTLKWNTHLTRKLVNGDRLELHFTGGSRNEKQKQYSIDRLDYLQEEGRNDHRNQFADMPSKEYDYEAIGVYDIHWPSDWNLRSSYHYAQSYEGKGNGLYRLDLLDGWQTDALHPIGALPSTRDSLLQAIDAANSYDYNQLERSHQLFIQPHYIRQGEEGEFLFFALRLPIRHVTQRLHYHSLTLDTCASQRHWDFDPTLDFSYYTKNYTRGISLSYGMDMTQPSLYQQLDITNDRNPLHVRKGNPDLKGSTTHRVSVSAEFTKPERQQSLNFTYELNFFLDQVAQGYTFDPVTGGYTYMPQNVNGNWQTALWANFGRTIDKQQRWRWSTNTHADYTRNVDITAVEGETGSALSKVDNWYVREQLSLDYQFGKLRAGLNGSLSWRNATGNQRDVQEVNAFDFQYGLTCTYELPWQVKLSTDLKMFSRRGYGESSMNTDDLVWNASLSRSWLKGRLTSRLEGFDLLNQISGNQIYINGQGRTETHRNCLPRYVMLHIAYNISIMPKGKK